MASAEPSLLLLLLTLVLAFFTPSLASHVSLSVSPKTLTRSDRTVHIQWSGIDSPSDLDWLGIYSPPSSRNNEFIGYVFLNSSSTWQSGYGSVDLPLVNLRSNYVFRVFRWTRNEVSFRHHDHDGNPLPQTKHRLAVSDEIGFGSGLGPEQIHLSFTDRDDEMRVLFVTADGKENFVRYGMNRESLNLTVKTEVRRYERYQMCDFPANDSIGWRDPGFTHDGVMTSLQKGARYYYQVGSDSSGWSPISSFISRDSDSNETIAFLFGDMGTYTPYSTFYRTQDESRSTVKWILRDLQTLSEQSKSALVSHIGDISYARGFSWIWDEFFNQIEPIASTIPYHVCIGNHEYDWPGQPWKPWWSYSSYNKDGGGECGVPYSVRFRMPGNSALPTGTGAPDTRNLYYSFDAGVVHFLYFSTETNFLQGSDQYNFMKYDLERVDRERTPFIVVQGHRPMYTTSNEARDAQLREQLLQNLEPLLVQYKVTLALWGHVHRYERFCPVKNFKCVNVSSSFKYQGAPVHLVIGMAGQDWQPIWEPRPDHEDRPIFPQPERSMYRGGEFGYTRLFATKEKLRLEYVGNHDGQVHDSVEIFSDLFLDSGNNNGSSISSMNSTDTKVGETKEIVVEPKLTPYVKVGSVVLGSVLLGYALGFLTRWKREKDSVKQPKWTPVKSEEETDT